MGQSDTRCCRVLFVLCFSLMITNAVRHRMLTLRQEIPGFSLDNDVKGRASCGSICQKRTYWGK